MKESSYYTSSTEFSLCNLYPTKVFVSGRFLSQSNNECEICLKSEPIFLLTCATCSVSVHSICYKIETFQDPWQCQKCLLASYSLERAKCHICQQTSGALRLFPDGWAHFICLNWPNYENYSDEKCSFCNLSKGNFLNCEICLEMFHPYCGYLSGLRKNDSGISCGFHSKTIQSESEESHKPKRRGRKKKVRIEEKENINPKNSLISDDSQVDKLKKGRKPFKKRRKYVRRNSKDIEFSTNSVPFDTSLIPINWQGSKEQVLQKFEDFLFNTCEVCDSAYLLDSNLQSIFRSSKIFFRDLPSMVSSITLN